MKIFAEEVINHNCAYHYDYDTDGNCIYKGYNKNRNALDNNADWYITKYDYDIDGNCTRQRIKVTSWTSRDSGW